MGRKYKRLFEKVIDIENLRLAYHKTVLGGKRYKASHLNFKDHLEYNLNKLSQEIKDGSYTHSKYHLFTVYEPKKTNNKRT